MNLYLTIETFFNAHIKGKKPVLLALSGGSDSLFLFYCLLRYRESRNVTFHVAHVDHGWRTESSKECSELKCLADRYHVPFHTTRLNPENCTGNLESACREARYLFFKGICDEYDLEGVITGHHRDDRSETIFKRLMEGSHWLRWDALKAISQWQGMSILRPLHSVRKKQILSEMEKNDTEFFNDPTNKECRFLRSRLRETLIPTLNAAFGKEVESSLHVIGNEMSELSDYFRWHLKPLMDSVVHGPFGSCLRVVQVETMHIAEIKIAVRLFAEKETILLSREMVDHIARALHREEANRRFPVKEYELIVDRGWIFLRRILENPLPIKKEQEISMGTSQCGHWKITVSEEIFSSCEKNDGWQEGWRQGKSVGYLPMKSIQLTDYSQRAHWKNKEQIKKKWNQAKVPAFLYSFFPLILSEGLVCHEFLSGKSVSLCRKGDRILKIEIKHCTTEGYIC